MNPLDFLIPVAHAQTAAAPAASPLGGLQTFLFPILGLVPSAHGVLAIYMKREDRKHEEVVEAIRRHGPPPGYKP